MASGDLRVATDGAVLRCAGGVYDRDDVGEFAGAVRAALARVRRSIVVDMSALDFFSSLAVGAAVTLRREARRQGADVAFFARPDTVAHRVLSVAGIPIAASDVPG
ncbi:MAG TPA: STAS domain-containing protein [Nocardioides sp.]